MQDQDELIARKADFEDVASEANDRAILEDIGYTADLYSCICISPSNQEDNTQL